jgi:hypothetical protein
MNVLNIHMVFFCLLSGYLTPLKLNYFSLIWNKFKQNKIEVNIRYIQKNN